MHMNEQNKLFETYQKEIFRFILLKTGHLESAEDLTSESFVKFFTYIEKNKSREHHYRGLLYSIAKGLVINYYRDQRTIQIDIEDIEIVDLKDSADEQLDRAIQVEQLQTAVLMLPPALRTLIELRFIRQLEYSEIAEITGKREGAIRMGISRAIKQLKELLATALNQ
ncbi:sigma-70 family RNA polymerase sigma factor [Candidatus Uhrbacteria bacterium]|nr:sigma-70 family RNA polymerase sigma factor [Candidatus Uhrbacteria bacterium]